MTPTSTTDKKNGFGRLTMLMVSLGVVLIVVIIAITLMPSPQAVEAARRSMNSWRVGFIGGQIAALVLLWFYWPRFVDWVHRLRPMSEPTRRALLQGRKRIFMLLCATEAVIVLRALLS